MNDRSSIVEHMARPKLHERDETLRKALDFFWKNGFSGGSTRELGQALDMHPGSIYSAFGSKEGLCLEVLELYGKQSHEWFSHRLAEAGFFEGLKMYLTDVVIDKKHPCTCFVAKTLSSHLESEQNLVERAKELMEEFRRELRSRVEEAQQAGEIGSGVDLESFATLVQVQLMGVRSFADSVDERAALEKAIEEAVGLLRLAAR